MFTLSTLAYRNENSVPCIEVAERIAKAFGIKLSALIAEAEKAAKKALLSAR